MPGTKIACMAKEPYVYILTNQRNGTLYVGVTANLVQRIYLHRMGCTEGFTKKYNCKRLVYFEQFDRLIEAFEREKQLKNWKRQWKLQLIHQFNPEWKDLYPEII
jgi:putative endonuclease